MHLSGYRRVLSWMVKDTLFRFPWANIAGVGLHFSGLFLQVGAVTIALFYAKRLEGNKPLSAWGFEFIPRESMLLLMCVGAATGVLLLCSSLFTWGSKKLILNLRRRYYEYCSDRVFQLVADRGEPAQLKDREQQVRSLFLLVRRDGLYCSRYYGALISAVVPAITAAIALITLTVTDLLLTACLVLFLMIGFPFILQGNRRSSNLSNQVDQRAPACSVELKAALRDGLNGAEVRGRPFVESAGWLDAYMGRLGAAIHSDLVIMLLMSVAITALIVGVGYQALSTESGWGRIAIYLVALRYFLSHLQGFVRCITTMNQFHSQASRYRAYVVDGSVPVEAGILDDLEDGSTDL